MCDFTLTHLLAWSHTDTDEKEDEEEEEDDSEVKSTMSGASHSGQGVELAWACAPPLANAVALPNAWLL